MMLATIVLARGGQESVPDGVETAAEPPRLVVLLVIDQFTSEYLELYRDQWSHGLKRLFDEGALFAEGAYPYAATATCAGHATIGTGAYPQRHGMVGNQWYDRELDKTVTCEEDSGVEPVALSDGTTNARHSAAYMKVPGLADELRRQLPRQPNIVSIAEKARSAIGLGGHGGPGTVVVWRGSGQVWSTSSAYTTSPWPDAATFIKQHPISDAYDQLWTKLLPESSYRFVDDDPAEPTPAPWGRTFPHRLHAPKGLQDGVFTTAWSRSPWADAFVVDLAVHLLQTRRLGQEPGTDMLALSLASLDGTGHQFGPRSHEVQDVLARADAAIGRLLDALDAHVGQGHYILAMSADHGVARLPEQVIAEGGEAGRIGPLGAVVNNLLQWTFGPGRHVGLASGTQIALTPTALERLRRQPEVRDLLVSVLAASPGVAKVFDREQLSGTDEATDADLRASRLSFMADRSGDFGLVLKPGWIYSASGTDHGTQNAYDQRVPVLLFGAGVRKGVYGTSASPADLAPTLASVTGITLPHAQGRVLSEALAH